MKGLIKPKIKENFLTKALFSKTLVILILVVCFGFSFISDASAARDFKVQNTEGVPFFFIEGDNGRVGISTINPGYTLDILSPDAIDSYMRVQRYDGDVPVGIIFSTGASGPIWSMYTEEDSSDLLFDSAGTVAAIITEDGYLGIGPDYLTPAGLLDVNNKFIVTDQQIVMNVPLNLAAAGDISIASDLQFTNPTASYIKSYAPLYIEAGDSSQNVDLTLRGSNLGRVIVDDSFKVTGEVDVSSNKIVNLATPIEDTDAATKDYVDFSLVSGDADWAGVGGDPTLMGDIYHTGSVGIGTSAPSATLDVWGDLILDEGKITTDNLGNITAESYYDGSYYLNPDRNDGFGLYIADSIQINGTTRPNYFAGSVGIGTDDPSTTLEVNGDIKSTGVLEANNFYHYGTDNIWIDTGAQPTPASAIHNLFISAEAGSAITTGDNNVGIGYQALTSNLGGSQNVAIGYQALTANTSSDNVAIGYGALSTNTTGQENTAIGRGALEDNTEGLQQTAIGKEALNKNTTGTRNTAIGASALQYNRTGSYNFALGYQASYGNLSGFYNVAIGESALLRNETGWSNTIIGNDAYSYGGLADSYNTVLGAEAGRNIIGNENTIMGRRAGYNSITQGNGNYNVFIGADVVRSRTSGDKNIVIGHDIDLPTATTSNMLNIGNIIFGTDIDGVDTIISTGKIGIGTTIPGAKLTVGNDAFMVTDAGIVSAGEWQSTDVAVAHGGTGTSTGSITGTEGNDLTFTAGGTNQDVILTPSGTGYTLLGGSVGIGTDNPQTTLHIEGDGLILDIQDTIAMDMVLISGNTDGLAYWKSLGDISGVIGSGTENYLPKWDATNNGLTNSGVYESVIGDIGIGTDDPNAKLDVWGNIETDNITLSGQFSGGTLYTTDGATINNSSFIEDYGIFVGGPDDNYFSGNVGIGTINPQSKIHIKTDSDIEIFRAEDETGTKLTVIDKDGDVGIGTSNPQGTLDINGDMYINTYTAATYKTIDFVPGANNVSGLFRVQGRGATTYDAYGMVNIGGAIQVWGSSGSQRGIIGTEQGGDMVFTTQGAGTGIRFMPLSTTSMYLATDGNVGIGTTSPQSKTHIILQTAETGTDAFRVDDESSDLTPFVIDDSGNVGIGTDDPSTKLDIYGDLGADNITLSNRLSGGTIYTNSGATINNSAFQSGYGVYVGGTDDDNYFAGSVGIGTISPSTELEVDGTVTATSFVGNGSGLTGMTQRMGIFVGKTTNTYNGLLTFSTLTGYQAGNAICNADFAGSHMCTEVEIIDTINKEDISGIADWVDTVWVNAGGTKYVPASSPVNDCNGWKYSGQSTYLGSFWIFDSATGGNGAATLCSQLKELACCQ